MPTPDPDAPVAVAADIPDRPSERLDDPTEDLARAGVSVAEIVAEDVDSPHTPSFRSPIHPAGMAGFGVEMEPVGLADDDTAELYLDEPGGRG